VTTLEFDSALDLERLRQERHARLVDAMGGSGLDALLLLGGANVLYATGARGPSADQSRALHQRPVALVTVDDPPHVWTWWDDPDARAGLDPSHLHDGVQLESASGARAFVGMLTELLGPDASLAVDEVTMPLRAALTDAGLTTGDATTPLATAKVMKTADEIECLRRAQRINEAAIQDVAPHATAGTAATTLTGHFLRRIIELGASWNNVDPIWQVMPASVAEGPFSATHGVVFPTVTTPQPLARGDVVWVDNGIAYEGYMSDYGHTWVVDEAPSAGQREQCRRWRAVVDATLAVTKPGATARDLTRAAIAAAGLSDGRRPWLPHLYLAHGSGTESAEPPFVGTDLGDAFDESVVLAPGMVMVLEPVIWDDGEHGFRAEQVVAVTDSGWTSLSELTWDEWE
jgi:Xaa-Pro dipeptidase